MSRVSHIAGRTYHGRRGAVRNGFSYGVDYLRLEPEAAGRTPWLFSRNRRNFAALHDRDHGGQPRQGRGAAWAREVLAAHGVPARGKLELIAQPRILGHVFNPVSFWLAHDRGGRLIAVIPEVTNTYGDRHSYLCHRHDFAPITAETELVASKMLHVSPFQEVSGEYRFRFDIRPEKVAIRIDYRRGNAGLVATLAGNVRPLTSPGLLWAALRRPLGSRRVLALIHWQALKLLCKGARFRSRPEPPMEEVSR